MNISSSSASNYIISIFGNSKPSNSVSIKEQKKVDTIFISEEALNLLYELKNSSKKEELAVFDDNGNFNQDLVADDALELSLKDAITQRVMNEGHWKNGILEEELANLSPENRQLYEKLVAEFNSTNSQMLVSDREISAVDKAGQAAEKLMIFSTYANRPMTEEMLDEAYQVFTQAQEDFLKANPDHVINTNDEGELSNALLSSHLGENEVEEEIGKMQDEFMKELGNNTAKSENSAGSVNSNEIHKVQNINLKEQKEIQMAIRQYEKVSAYIT